MPNLVWTDAQKEFIRANADKLKDVELAVALSKICQRHVTLNSVRQTRQRLGIRKKQGRGICEISRNKITPCPS
jgi:hypothetical protein